MPELLVDLARANLAGAIAVLAVLVLRGPVRRILGAEAAYRLWVAPPLVVFASLLPAREILGAAAPMPAPEWAARHALLLFGVWLAGAVAMFVLLMAAQLAFQRAARRGRGGPALVGLVAPRILMPPDDGRFTESERILMRAHEREHRERGDPWANALMAALQCLLWANPLTHLAVRTARLDQEIACDADVLRRRPPQARALYARTLLKAEVAATGPPFAALWAAHPLEARIRVLSGSQADHACGPLVAGFAAIVAAASAWAMAPPVPPSQAFEWNPPEPQQPTMSVMIIRTPAPSA